MSAVLLPMGEDGAVDWDGLAALLERTVAAGLTPAVNMDTGYGPLLDSATRAQVLAAARQATQENEAGFAAGAFVSDQPGERFSLDAYRREIEQIEQHGGTPVIFQSFGLVQQAPAAIVESYAKLSEHCRQFIAFELGEMFAPFGMIYNLETYQAIMAIENCLGAKHSSLSRQLEWERLELRDRLRPEFLVLTGNDLAIDMVMYGSDYLLGLSAFAPDLFALRDKLWEESNAAFYELNDALQYLGAFAFRHPTPAYKHTAAQFLKLRGWIGCDATHPRSRPRPASDLDILREILARLESCSEAQR